MHIWIRGSAPPAAGHERGGRSEYIFHSLGHSLKILLDIASYKLYYVNYEIGLLSRSVRNLFKTAYPWESGFRFPTSALTPANSSLPRRAAFTLRRLPMSEPRYVSI